MFFYSIQRWDTPTRLIRVNIFAANVSSCIFLRSTESDFEEKVQKLSEIIQFYFSRAHPCNFAPCDETVIVQKIANRVSYISENVMAAAVTVWISQYLGYTERRKWPSLTSIIC